MAFQVLGAYLGLLHSPVTTNPPSNSFWGIDASFQYGDTTLISGGSGIFDTSSTTIRLATGKPSVLS